MNFRILRYRLPVKLNIDKQKFGYKKFFITKAIGCIYSKPDLMRCIIIFIKFSMKFLRA